MKCNVGLETFIGLVSGALLQPNLLAGWEVFWCGLAPPNVGGLYSARLSLLLVPMQAVSVPAAI